MKKLVFIFIILLCCSVIQVNAWAEKKVLNWSPPSNSIASGSVTRANTKISAVDGTAFVDFSTAGVLTNYAANKYRKLTLTDSTGKKLVGYIKAAGTGETYGDELVTNGDMETGDPPSSWTAQNSAVLSAAADERTSGEGSASLNIVISQTNYNLADAVQYVTVSQYGLYSVSAWAKNIDLSRRCQIVFSTLILTSSSTNWTALTGKVVATASSHGITIYAQGETVGQSMRCDDLSIKQILTPSTTGVTITSTPDGSTYNWATKEAGFNYNDVSGYTYTIERE